MKSTFAVASCGLLGSFLALVSGLFMLLSQLLRIMADRGIPLNIALLVITALRIS